MNMIGYMGSLEWRSTGGE